jgi:hypothetical protein
MHPETALVFSFSSQKEERGGVRILPTKVCTLNPRTGARLCRRPAAATWCMLGLAFSTVALRFMGRRPIIVLAKIPSPQPSPRLGGGGKNCVKMRRFSRNEAVIVWRALKPKAFPPKQPPVNRGHSSHGLYLWDGQSHPEKSLPDGRHDSSHDKSRRDARCAMRGA